MCFAPSRRAARLPGAYAKTRAGVYAKILAVQVEAARLTLWCGGDEARESKREVSAMQVQATPAGRRASRPAGSLSRHRWPLTRLRLPPAVAARRWCRSQLRENLPCGT